MLYFAPDLKRKIKDKLEMIATIKSVNGQELNISFRFYRAISENSSKREQICKVCGREASNPVRRITMDSLVKDEFKEFITDDKFYFCSTFMCPVVYFKNDPDVYFTKETVKVRVGIKEANPPITVCYCLNVDEQTILNEIVVKRCCDSIEKIKEYTKARTGRECHIKNPSGKCCGEFVKRVLDKGLALVVDESLKQLALRSAEQIPED